MSLAIKAENISKKYIIGHQRAEQYATARDVIMHQLRGLKERLCHPLSMNKEITDIEEFWALQDINFEIQQGDRVGIIGRNGAGKSTLLKVLSRITEPTSGRITLSGRVASLLEVGTGFHPELSGRENIFLNGAILGMRKNEIKMKFDEIVAFAEVEKFLDTPVKRYSSGMYVRLAFAVAANLDPEILIIDEVLAVGDAKFQQKCLGKMESVSQEGRTVLFVSHNMGAIQQLTTKAILLDAGRIQYTGNTDAAVTQYLAKNNEEAGNKQKNIKTKDEAFRIKSFSIDQLGENYFNKPLRFILIYETSKNFENLNIGIGVYNSLGARLLTAKNVIEHTHQGEYKITGTIKDHRLPPGNYQVALGIGSLKSQLIYEENLIGFAISDKNIDDPLLVPYLANHRDKIGAFYELNYSVETNNE